MNQIDMETGEVISPLINPMKSDQIAKLATALAKAQAKMANAEKDAENPFFKSSYATLASVWDSCRGPLTANGLSVIQTTEEADRGTKLVTILAHESGEWIRSEMYLRPKDNTPQAIGSALTYARRYELAAIVGVSVADDDGESATVHNTGNKSQSRGKSKNGKVTAPPPHWSQDEAKRQKIEAALTKKGVAIEYLFKGCGVKDWTDMARFKDEGKAAFDLAVALWEKEKQAQPEAA